MCLTIFREEEIARLATLDRPLPVGTVARRVILYEHPDHE